MDNNATEIFCFLFSCKHSSKKWAVLDLNRKQEVIEHNQEEAFWEKVSCKIRKVGKHKRMSKFYRVLKVAYNRMTGFLDLSNDCDQLFLKNPTEYMSLSPSPGDRNWRSFLNVCVLVFRMLEDGQNLESQWFWSGLLRIQVANNKLFAKFQQWFYETNS